jgi:hypothetical protein
MADLFYPEGPTESDEDALPVAEVKQEHVVCPPELYAAHSTSVLREGDHWRCLICQPLDKDTEVPE